MSSGKPKIAWSNCRVALKDRPGAEIEPCAQHRVGEISARLSDGASPVAEDARHLIPADVPAY
jgi:hypothetical protein